MNDMYAISRVANYKFSDVGGVLKEALRILPNYNNPDCNSELSYLNVALVETDLNGLTPEKYILKYREDNNIVGRFNTNAQNPKNLTNVMCQALFTASADWINELDRDEQIQFFKDCLEFFNSEFPTVHVVAANIHFDETTPHMHITFLPIARRLNKKTNEEEQIFSTTQIMPGRDFFPQYQDSFFKFISSKYDGFSRGSSNRKNLSVQDYKEYKAMEELIEKQNEKIKYLYGELDKVKSMYSMLQDIPLLGKFINLIMNMRKDRLERLLSASIRLAERELEQTENKLHSSLDYNILSGENRKIISNLYRKKNEEIIR